MSVKKDAEQSKLESIYSFRIPLKAKNLVEALNLSQKAKLNHRLRVEIAKVLHECNFDPALYLGEDE